MLLYFLILFHFEVVSFNYFTFRMFITLYAINTICITVKCNNNDIIYTL